MRGGPAWAAVALGLVLLVTGGAPGARASAGLSVGSPAASGHGSDVANFTTALNRLVELLGLAGGAVLSLVWARVALSWFSNDVTKKIQAKDRARDALVGTLLFTAAVTGLFWGLAQWVFTGS